MAKSKKAPSKKTKKNTSKKSSKKTNKKFFLKPIIYYINIIIIILIVILLAFLTNAIFLDGDNNKNIKKNSKDKIIKNNKEDKLYNKIKFEEQTKELKIIYVNNTPKKQKILTNSKNSTNTIFNKIKDEKKIKKDIIKKDKNLSLKNKPLLAILIDDVTTSSQVKKAKKLPFKVTLSFLPPTLTHKDSAKIAQNLKVAMIHLPLESENTKSEETNTLHIEDSYAKIEQRIKYLKKLYPNVKYINNHTGSKFTSNLEAMDKLAKALKKYNYYFIDSRTTTKTKINTVANKYNLPYLSRNVFLDNEQNISYIQNQLKQAVKIAKAKGSAIAICHPHSITYKALAKSVSILKDVQLVYINKLHISTPR